MPTISRRSLLALLIILHNKDYLFITYLGVNPEYHSQGFGSQMLADLK